MHLIRRAAARTLTLQPARQLSTLSRPSARSSIFRSSQPAAARTFHQSRISRIDEDKTTDPVAQAIADEAVAEELKNEAIQAAEVAEAAGETAVNAQEGGASEVAEEATEMAAQAAEVAEAAAMQANATTPVDDVDVDVTSDAAAAAGGVAAAAAVTASSAARAASTGAASGSSFPNNQSAPSSSNRVLYIGNLFFEVNAQQLQAEFEKFGLITNVRIVTDSRGLSRGFGYVEFESADSAERAIREADQRVFQGRRMAVQLHRRVERSPRSDFQRREPQPPSKTLFIGNMSYQMSDKDLNDLFRDIRDVLDVRVAIDRRTGQPRGFAHADFVDEQAASRARDELQDRMVYGRNLRVDFAGRSANQRQQDPSGAPRSRGASEDF